MLIIGCDYHPSAQQIAFVETEPGKCGERRLKHREREAEGSYREVKQRGTNSATLKRMRRMRPFDPHGDSAIAATVVAQGSALFGPFC